MNMHEDCYGLAYYHSMDLLQFNYNRYDSSRMHYRYEIPQRCIRVAMHASAVVVSSAAAAASEARRCIASVFVVIVDRHLPNLLRRPHVRNAQVADGRTGRGGRQSRGGKDEPRRRPGPV